MSEHGREIIKDGRPKGRYCNACKTKKQREYRKTAKARELAAKHSRDYRERQREDHGS